MSSDEKIGESNVIGYNSFCPGIIFDISDPLLLLTGPV
jgi:hypothetical protein